MNGQDVNILFERGAIGYQFTYKDKPYGSRVKLPKKASKEDYVNVTFLVLTSYLETLTKLQNEN